MADYWVSRERHYCKYCNVWMQSDKQSIKHHEQGRKHKDKVEIALKHRRQAKSDAANAQKELQNQLQQIEKAAQIKYEQDMARGSTRAPPPPPRKGQNNAPPPPPTRPTPSNAARAFSIETRDRNVNVRNLEMSTSFHKAHYVPPLEQEEEEEEESSGVYAARGIVYLEGKKHATQLETGSACQIWVEEAEQWLDALVEQATVHPVPNTELSFRRFTIMYMMPGSQVDSEEKKAKPIIEQQVEADRLRIPLPPHVTLEAAEKMVEHWRHGDTAKTTARASILIDETTGMGEWRTVEVRQLDETSEEEAKPETTRLVVDQQRLDALEDFSSQGDNALGAFNPWGGSYKGVNLDNDTETALDRRTDEIQIVTNGNVSFKKRGEKKQKRRRIHTNDE